MSDDDGDGLLAKLIATAVVLAISPFTELGTGPAPIGTLGAAAALAIIWGFPLPVGDDSGGGSD